MSWVVAVPRYLGVLGLAFWVGGIAFYGSLVIPKAHEILSSHREVGFVTREVTGTANAMGAVVLGLLALHAALAWKTSRRGTRVTLATTWALMVAAQVTLFFLRAQLDAMLDPNALTIHDRARFMPLHERYLNVTGALCLAALAHLWAMLQPAPPPAR
ncbi:MAG TPA: hypothetical protein VF950_17740 [Planctomycetota bacterium]